MIFLSANDSAHAGNAARPLSPGVPYEVPGSCHIPENTPNPAIQAMGKALQLYGLPYVWRTGAHALYLQ